MLQTYGTLLQCLTISSIFFFFLPCFWDHGKEWILIIIMIKVKFHMKWHIRWRNISNNYQIKKNVHSKWSILTNLENDLCNKIYFAALFCFCFTVVCFVCTPPPQKKKKEREKHSVRIMVPCNICIYCFLKRGAMTNLESFIFWRKTQLRN